VRVRVFILHYRPAVGDLSVSGIGRPKFREPQNARAERGEIKTRPISHSKTRYTFIGLASQSALGNTTIQ